MADQTFWESVEDGAGGIPWTEKNSRPQYMYVKWEEIFIPSVTEGV